MTRATVVERSIQRTSKAAMTAAIAQTPAATASMANPGRASPQVV